LSRLVTRMKKKPPKRNRSYVKVKQWCTFCDITIVATAGNFRRHCGICETPIAIWSNFSPVQGRTYRGRIWGTNTEVRASSPGLRAHEDLPRRPQHCPVEKVQQGECRWCSAGVLVIRWVDRTWQWIGTNLWCDGVRAMGGALSHSVIVVLRFFGILWELVWWWLRRELGAPFRLDDPATLCIEVKAWALFSWPFCCYIPLPSKPSGGVWCSLAAPVYVGEWAPPLWWAKSTLVLKLGRLLWFASLLSVVSNSGVCKNLWQCEGNRGHSVVGVLRSFGSVSHRREFGAPFRIDDLASEVK